jgi:hypothetical protein
MDGYGGPSHP